MPWKTVQKNWPEANGSKLWQEMAKQVAHEIKKSIDSHAFNGSEFLAQRFDPSDENSLEKLNDFSTSIIQQIDTMITWPAF